jgi:hypothetical protein
MNRPATHIKIPGYCRHKARNSAYVRLDGHVHYLPGPYRHAIQRDCDVAFPPPAPNAKRDDETWAA